jgi:hypothetical protein
VTGALPLPQPGKAPARPRGSGVQRRRLVANHGQEIDRFGIERDTGLRAGLGLDLGGDIGDL